jgi:hypothetical protein
MLGHGLDSSDEGTQYERRSEVVRGTRAESGMGTQYRRIRVVETLPCPRLRGTTKATLPPSAVSRLAGVWRLMPELVAADI